MKAKDLKVGHVLVDPDGHLYEIVSVHKIPDDSPDGYSRIHAWLWPDSSPVPNYFQTFEPGDEIVAVNSSVMPSDDTAIIPAIRGDENVTVTGGVAE